ncbi:MAG: hypothetical protein GY952_03105 [Rhodobacteraceae bacterium]|nr:hypothetical protein [Paracoccaceae bacterium]
MKLGRARLSAFVANATQGLRRIENGAVTVDWIVISATIVVLGTVIVGMTRDGTTKIATEIGTELSAVPVS